MNNNLLHYILKEIELGYNFNDYKSKAKYRLLNCVLGLFDKDVLGDIFEKIFTKNTINGNDLENETKTYQGIKQFVDVGIYKNNILNKGVDYRIRNYARMSLYNFIEFDQEFFKNIIIKSLKAKYDE